MQIKFLMRKVLWLEAWLVVIAEDYTILHGAFCVGYGNYICGIQVEGGNDRLALIGILCGGEVLNDRCCIVAAVSSRNMGLITGVIEA